MPRYATDTQNLTQDKTAARARALCLVSRVLVPGHCGARSRETQRGAQCVEQVCCQVWRVCLFLRDADSAHAHQQLRAAQPIPKGVSVCSPVRSSLRL